LVDLEFAVVCALADEWSRGGMDCAGITRNTSTCPVNDIGDESTEETVEGVETFGASGEGLIGQTSNSSECGVAVVLIDGVIDKAGLVHNTGGEPSN
jgi:hypothetical protein